MAKKVDIDFDIIEGGSKYLKIDDISIWSNLVNTTSYVEILKPTYSEPNVHYFKKGAVNNYNSNHLQTSYKDLGSMESCDTLPDGVYTITVKTSCERYYTSKLHLRTNLLDLELSKYIVSNTNINAPLDMDKINSVTEVDYLIKSAKAHTEVDNKETATVLYNLAQEKLQDLQKEC